MDVERLQVEGYRSLADVVVEFGAITVVVGANGSGKSNLYRALRLAHSCGTGQVARRIALEGGMSSVVFAGWTERPVEKKVELSLDLDGMTYEVTLATAARGARDSSVAFPLDPVITHEQILLPVVGRRRVDLLDRSGSTAFVRDDEGNRITYTATFHASESVLTQLVDDARFPELHFVRDRLQRMRFHHQLRTDDDAPARRPSVGTRTLSVGDDGEDLAAALATILNEGESGELERLVEEALGGRLVIVEDGSGRVEVGLDRPRLKRPLSAGELSDGQLRFLHLAAALLSPRPPAMIVLNEPESSLHSSLVPALAELVRAASARTQVVVTTHSTELAAALLAHDGAVGHRLSLAHNRTTVDPY